MRKLRAAESAPAHGPELCVDIFSKPLPQASPPRHRGPATPDCPGQQPGSLTTTSRGWSA